MTNEAIRVACAEACGWKTYEENPDCLIRHPDGGLVPPTLVPDYLNDLNACHEMEKTLSILSSPMHERYAIELGKILETNEEGELNDWDCWMFSHATARQRCEAFLRTLGKWVEEGKV